LIGGALAVAVGLAWDLAFPINKNLWTSSYAIFTAGAASVILGACYWTIDVRGQRWWVHPFVVLGSNAIVLFVLSGVIARTLNLIQVPARAGGTIALKTYLYQSVFVPFAAPKNASLCFALANLVVLYGVLAVLYRRRWFLRL
jgi:predicted acyltransferase